MPKNLSKLSILIAEDDEITRTIMVKKLAHKNYQVISAANGQQAVDLCYQEYPQVVLMDANMPVLNGFEACRLLKQADDKEIRDISVIIVTARNDHIAIDQAFAAGAEDYISKPVNWYLLEHRLDLMWQKIQAQKALLENEQRFYSIAESANDAIISVNSEGKIIFCNKVACQVFGYEKAELLHQPLVILIPEHLRPLHLAGFARINQYNFNQLRKTPYQLQGLKKNSTIFALELTLSAWTADQQRFYSCILRDVTERLKKQEEINKLSTAVQQSPNLVIMTDKKGIIDYANPQLTPITGYEYDEVIGRNVNLLRSGNTSRGVYHELWQTIEQGRTWVGILQNKKKNGDLFWAKESISPIFNSEGLISHFIAIQEDITQTKNLSDEIAYRASHDPLTGLINRHEFERRLATLMQESSHLDTHCLCFIDLDRFKIVNDTAGHLAGDELLRQLAKQMKTSCRQQDVLARLGGDEFALILSYCHLNQALQIANKLLTIINDFQLNWEQNTFKVGSSIGLVSMKKGDNPIQILKFADTACYAAKNTGRNKVYVFNKDDKYLSTQAVEVQWVSKIEHALTHNRFVLYAQPIVSLTGYLLKNKYEILLRLLDENDHIIPPNAFLPAAERFSLATQIDYWVIEQTLLWFSTHTDKLYALDSFSINLSGQSLANEKLLDFILSLINKYRFPTDKLTFEITETAAINNLGCAQLLIAKLKKIGVRFALDDFGSGLSSFAYLKNLPVDFLKIDGVFIKNIAHDPIDCAMVKSIAEIGQVMGKKTIAEFVENQDIVTTLQTLNVDFAQGYYYSKPVPLMQIK